MRKSIIFESNDNVATSLTNLKRNDRITIDREGVEEVTIQEQIPFGHKYAINTIRKGEHVKIRDYYRESNLGHTDWGTRTYTQRRKPSNPNEQKQRRGTVTNQFYGFKRPDGRVGTRNTIPVIALTETARVASEAIARSVQGVTSVNFPYGRAVNDSESVIKTIIGYGTHPNVYGTILIDMPGNQAEKISKLISQTGKPVKPLAIMGSGTVNTIKKE